MATATTITVAGGRGVTTKTTYTQDGGDDKNDDHNAITGG